MESAEGRYCQSRKFRDGFTYAGVELICASGASAGEWGAKEGDGSLDIREEVPSFVVALFVRAAREE